MPRLTIPHPCPADRSQMTPTQQGRYCELCQKEVIDFSRISDAEIRSVLAKSKGKVCASLREDQVGRYIGPVSWPKRWFALGLGATLLGPMMGLAQTPSHEVEQAEPRIPIRPIVPPHPTKPDSVVFQGKVTDSETGEPVWSATVMLKGTDIETFTDAEGRYELVCPESILRWKDSLTLVVIGFGWEREEIIVSKMGHKVDVEMASVEITPVILGGMPAPTRWQRFQWWITTPFRWVKGFR